MGKNAYCVARFLRKLPGVVSKALRNARWKFATSANQQLRAMVPTGTSSKAGSSNSV